MEEHQFLMEPFDGKDYRALSLVVDGLRRQRGLAPLSQLEWAAVQRAVAEEKVLFYLARQDGEIAAGCSLALGYSCGDCSRYGLVDNLYCLPRYCQGSLPGQMMEWLRQELVTLGGETLYAVCHGGEREFWAQHGYTEPGAALLERS